MKRIYLASSSIGNRELVKGLSKTLSSSGYFVFSPCLAFSNEIAETMEIRDKIIEVYNSSLQKWAEIFIFMYEGIESEGSKAELELSKHLMIPSVIFSPVGVDSYIEDMAFENYQTMVIVNIHNLIRRLNVL